MVFAGCVEQPVEEPHQCSSVCSTCGGCTDLTCTEQACANKCRGHVSPEPPPIIKQVVVSAKVTSLTIKDNDLDGFDFSEQFLIVEDGNVLEVKSEYLSGLPTGAGDFTVVCSYGDKSASIPVHVVPTVVTVSCSLSEVTLTTEQVSSYDFLSLFTAIKDGMLVEIGMANVRSDVKSVPGEYTLTVVYGNASASLKVIVKDQIEISVVKSATIKDTAVATYDFTQLFFIRKNGKNIAVTSDMIDLSGLPSSGKGTVVCNYQGESKRAEVTIVATVYQVTAVSDELSMHYSAVDGYDFAALFSAYIDGVQVTVTNDMLQCDVKAQAGTYSCTVTCGNASKTISIVVTDNHHVQAYPAFADLTIGLEQVADFDFTTLFWLYVDNRAAQVTADMIDSSAVRAEEGEYTVKLKYKNENTTDEFFTVVKVGPLASVEVSVRNVVVYPNSEAIDLTSLFTVTVGGKNVEVTASMIQGKVDYENFGVNEITLTYNGQTYVATVEVRKGVLIETKADVIEVVVGTDSRFYDFAADFTVLVNGIPFYNVDNYIDLSKVDFGKAGDYEVTISIPFNDQKGTLSGAKFQYYSESITYRVVENVIDVSVKQQVVDLTNSGGSVNLTDNVLLYVNGYKQSFTSQKDYVDLITCYYEIETNVDWTKSGEQTVTLLLFANGVDKTPVTLSYKVNVKADVVIDAMNKVVYSGDTLYPLDLFTITDCGQSVEVTYQMLAGKADVFTPGVYTVTATYKGVSATSIVTVMDSSMLGTFRTQMRTIPVEDEEDEEGNVTAGVGSKPIGNVVITRESIVINGLTATVLSAPSYDTLIVKDSRNNRYTLHFSDGILVADPDNSNRMTFSDYKRPLVYYNQALWTAKNHIVVNSGAQYVIGVTTMCYSIDLFALESIKTNKTIWYGLKVELLSRSASDTDYSVEWGTVLPQDNFSLTAEAVNTVLFNGKSYEFTMSSAILGKINVSEDAGYEWAHVVLSGTINGQRAELQFGRTESITLIVNGSRVFDSFSITFGNSDSKNAYVNHKTGEVFVYTYTKGYYSYKFLVDVEAGTFQYVPSDNLVGYYELGKAFIYLDGYGTGHVSFDNTSHATQLLTYRRYGNEIAVEYGNGQTASLLVSDLLNVLTVKQMSQTEYVGTQFVNKYVADGAIVNFVTTDFAATKAKTDLYDAIVVTTKDGALTGVELKNSGIVGVTTVVDSVRGVGYHQFTITLTVGGNQVVGYYALQVLAPKYQGHSLVGNYRSVTDDSFCVNLDEYGKATILIGTESYVGSVIYYDDAMFIKARTDDGQCITAKGTLLVNNIVKIDFYGALKVSGIFTTLQCDAYGTDGAVLRKYGDVWLYSVSRYGTCEIVEVQDIGNGESKVLTSSGEIIVKLLSVGDYTNGLVVADATRGNYSDGQNNTLWLDGFGVATYNGNAYECENQARNTVLFFVDGDMHVYQIDTARKTFSVYSVQLDYATFAGTTYQANHRFVCESISYEATTSFLFRDDGTVDVTSLCSTHDEELSDNCGEVYKPAFNATSGRYTITQNVVTITVGDATFSFKISDVVMLNKLVCTSTTLTSEQHGYFAVGTAFTIE